MGARGALVAVCAACLMTACTSTMAEPPDGAEPPADRTYDGTPVEWVNEFADCMRKSGFAVTVDESVPTFLPADDLPDDQIGAWDEAFDKCREDLGPPPVEPLDPEQLPKLYEATLAAKVCLEDLGFAISEPPSLQAWIESYDSPSGPWLPHRDLPQLPEEEWLRVNSACPQP